MGRMMGDHIDLSSEPPWPSRSLDERGRRFLGVHFACCGAYARAYLSRDGSEYLGRCPRCLGKAKFVIGETGESGQFFTVS